MNSTAEQINSELLKAAEDFVQWVDDVWGSAALGGERLKEYEDARAAIKKAKGDGHEAH